MKIVLQRVSRASVVVEGEEVGAINEGLLLLVGFGRSDDEELFTAAIDKIANLRIFPDEKGRFHYSVKDIQGGVLLVPQFTLYADTKKGRRPEFFNAMEPKRAEQLFDRFTDSFRSRAPELSIASGSFGADMKVSLLNDGPVTILFEWPPNA